MDQFLRSASQTGFLEIWLPLMSTLSLSFSLSLPLLFRLIHWGAEALRVYLLAWASKTHVSGSPRRGTLHYSSGRWWPNVDGANLLFGGFISFPRKPRYSVSILHSVFYNNTFHNLSYVSN